MVKHLILWKLKEELSEEDKKQVKGEIKAGLEGLLGKIPGLVVLKNKRHGKSVNEKTIHIGRNVRKSGLAAKQHSSTVCVGKVNIFEIVQRNGVEHERQGCSRLTENRRDRYPDNFKSGWDRAGRHFYRHRLF